MPRKSSPSREDEIVEILQQILRVLSLQVGADKGITQRARLLKLAGLDNATIAEVLDTTPATVRAVTAGLRTKRIGGRRTRSQ